jgi:hypothetical protein
MPSTRDELDGFIDDGKMTDGMMAEECIRAIAETIEHK